jgi:hypothetical protein
MQFTTKAIALLPRSVLYFTLHMTYKDKLSPWCIIRPLPDMKSQFIARFRNRSDADGHLRILQVNNPTAFYEIIFDVTPKHSGATAKQQLPQFDEME